MPKYEIHILVSEVRVWEVSATSPGEALELFKTEYADCEPNRVLESQYYPKRVYEVKT